MADIEYLDKTEDTNIPESDPRRSFTAADANEVKAAVNSKVDKVTGKSLSTNDYTNTDKEKVTNLPTDTNAALSGKANTSHTHSIDNVTGLQGALDGKVDKVTGKGLSTEDYTTSDKNKVSNLPANTVSELANKVNVVPGKQLSQENFTSAEKSKLAALSVTYVGTYTSLSALQAAYPTGQAGYEAIIDGGVSQDPQKAFWDVSDTQWVIQTGGGASSFSELAGSPSDNAALQAAFDTKSNVGHTHAISDVSGLGGALDAKSDVGHGHAISDVSGLQTALDGKAAASHSHSIGQISGLGTTLAGKEDNTNKATNLSSPDDTKYPTTKAVSDALVLKADDNAVVKLTGNQSIAGEKEFTSGVRAFRIGREDANTSYTLQLSDRGLWIIFTSSSNVTVTIPTNATAAFAIDTEIIIVRGGTGEVTIAPAGGVTALSAGNRLRISEQHGAVILKKRGTDTWRVVGGTKI